MTTTTPPRCAYSSMTQRGASTVVLLDTNSYPAASNYLNQTWTWNGTDWARFGSGTVDASGPLPLRNDASMVYDGYNVMLFGGRGESSLSGTLQDTWTFNGTAWTKEAPATIPFGRFKHKLGFISLASAQKVVMVGGSNILNFLNETWVWNGSAKTWTLAASTSYPAARVDFMFAGGPTFCVLFGGKSTNSTLQDTWKFDGSQWTQLSPTTPPPIRHSASLTYDTANTQWVMFGGANNSRMLSAETWTLNSTGTAWTQKSPATSPAPRMGAQMCYDAQAGKVIMFGGTDSIGNALSDTWSWNGTTWAQL